MTRALLRTGWSDLRRHRLQSVLLFVILATAALTLSLAVTVHRVTSGPFERLMAETNGAHVWFGAGPGVDLGGIAQRDGVEEAVGPFPVIEANLADVGASGSGSFPLMLFGQSADMPAVGRPVIRDGRWLQGPGEIVLDPDIAQFMRLRPGDHLAVQGSNGPVDLLVVGLAVHLAAWHTEGDGVTHPPTGYVLPETLAGIAPDRSTWGSVLGVRIGDASKSAAFATAAVNALPPGSNVIVTDWHDVRRDLTADSNIDVLLLRVFSAFALVAAALVIANSISGRVLAQFREIGLLKAVGFTPRGILTFFLGEHLAIGLAGGVVGMLIGALMAPLFENNLSALLTTTPVSSFAPLPLLFILLLVEGAVTLATLVPAIRAARVSVVQAITVGFVRTDRRRSLLARAGAKLKLQPPVVLGLKDAFARPIRSWMTVAALVLTVVTLTFSLGLEATMADLLHHPAKWGAPYDITVTPDGQTAQQTEQAIAGVSAIDSYVGRLAIDVRAGGNASQITAFALEGNTQPYAASVPEGHLFAAPGEAIAGQALLDDLGIGVGDTMHLTVGGVPLNLKVVGRYVDTEYDGHIVLFGLDTYRAQVDPSAQPDEFLARFAPGAAGRDAINALNQASGGQVQVEAVDLGAGDDVMRIRAVLVVLNVVLLVIGAVNLLSTTLLGIRERFRDLGILKTVGLAPGQVVTSVLTGVGALTMLAIVVGIPLGMVVTRALFDVLGNQIGIGSGVGTMPGWIGLTAVVPTVLALGLLGGLLPAQRAGRLRIADALRYE
jgi:putative ABC transport system permease protein